MREIVLDTETTGLEPRSGDRIVEIGCLELVNRIATGETFHHRVNPEREVPTAAEAIHGISTAMLAEAPLFGDIAEALMAFLGESKLVIHNAGFDLGFLNAELERLGRAPIDAVRAVDTLQIARRKFPGAPASLDALCKRFAIDTSARTFHGALLDATLLADVYVELVGGRQAALGLAAAPAAVAPSARAPRTARPPRAHAPPPEELAAHEAFLDRLKSPIWRGG